MTRLSKLIIGSVSLVLFNLSISTAAQTAIPLSIDSAASLEVREPHQQNLTIAIFEAGIPKDTSTHRQFSVYPEVRLAEARFLPFVLREALVESNEWGAVRVSPEISSGDEISIRGTINKSDGETLELRLSAHDALGREWLNNLYAMESGTKNPLGGPEISASFKNLFVQFANDLQAKRASYDTAALVKNSEVALLRYAQNLLPDTYGQYLVQDTDGSFSLQRLPARNDPMLERIKRIREFEYRLTDVIDEQYKKLYSEIAPTYNLWLRYQERLTRYRVTGEQRRQNTESTAARGSYSALRQSYEHYRWLKLQEQNLRSWARGFSNEVEPTMIEIGGRIVALEGTLEQRYSEWGDLLRTILQAESGTIAAP